MKHQRMRTISYICVGRPLDAHNEQTNQFLFLYQAKLNRKPRALVICIHILRQKGLAQPAEAMICANLISRAYKLELDRAKMKTR